MKSGKLARQLTIDELLGRLAFAVAFVPQRARQEPVRPSRLAVTQIGAR